MVVEVTQQHWIKFTTVGEFLKVFSRSGHKAHSDPFNPLSLVMDPTVQQLGKLGCTLGSSFSTFSKIRVPAVPAVRWPDRALPLTTPPKGSPARS